MMRLAAVVFLILLLLPAVAVAGPLEDGKAAYDRKDYETALKLLQPLADQGNPQAQYQIGKMIFYGQDFTRDRGDEGQRIRGYQDAFKWYKKAADQGYAPAQVEVGQMYRVYKGGPVSSESLALKNHDDAEAMKWFLKAAAQGNADAEFDIGVLYDFGNPGVPKDDTEKLKWWHKAAEEGQTGAQVALGQYYRSGWWPDYAEALKWFRMAAEQGHRDGLTGLGAMYEKGEGVKQDYVQAYMWYSLGASRMPEGAWRVPEALSKKMTSEQIEEAKRLAAEWKTAHSKLTPAP